MDHSYSESDVSLSPSQLLERLQVLRQLQLLQRGKLQKHRLEYQEVTENATSLTEIVSHFGNSTSYNTFRSLLDTSVDSSNDVTPREALNGSSHKIKEKDMIDGVSVLNLSQESEFILNSPTSTQSGLSHQEPYSAHENSNTKFVKKHISLEEMPILSPKKDFEGLILEKLQSEVNKKIIQSTETVSTKAQNKKQFLRRGEGTSRFGLHKKDYVIQNTKSLPWRRKSMTRTLHSPVTKFKKNLLNDSQTNVEVTISETKQTNLLNNSKEEKVTSENLTKVKVQPKKIDTKIMEINGNMSKKQEQIPLIELSKRKHPLSSMKGKTWATVLSKEQNDFLQQLKQSEYYKNFASPTKSTVSDISCDGHHTQLEQQKETAEQNMFELLENKVSHESFSLENSFFSRFLRQNQIECSGESTPVVLQQCIARNPNLMHIFPNLNSKKSINGESYEESCNSECTECCNETSSSETSSCSCKTVEETNNTGNMNKIKKNKREKYEQTKEKVKQFTNTKRKHKDNISHRKEVENDDSQKNVISDNDDNMKANMVEMNAKLIATSELLKDRLRELEDEIEIFRKENTNLSKMREEHDTERQKFYEEKSMFEKKFNEEKILSEYYIAEERDKLTKQKQMYEKYVRELKGRLSKKDKEEVLNLKQEINDLKEEIRLKDAKSTSTIARLRNQIKIMEKDKKDLQNEIEKLKKENRRIQHNNDLTRRMTNIKYLEEINRKLTSMTPKDSETNIDTNAKYKSLEIERQSRPRKLQTTVSRPMVRAKSVPNLKVTSRYAKYFSQRDVVSDMERNEIVNIEPVSKCNVSDDDNNDELVNVGDYSIHDEDENNLEKLYMERFHSESSNNNDSNICNLSPNIPMNSKPQNGQINPDKFFITKSNSVYDSSPDLPINNSLGSNSHRSNSPISITSNRSYSQMSLHNSAEHSNKAKERISNTTQNLSKSNTSISPISILTNKSSQNPATVIHKEYYRDSLNLSPEPTSRTSVTKTNLNPTEIKKPDGTKELRFPNGNVKFISADGRYSKFLYYNGDIKENFYDEGRIKYFYIETKTYHTTHADGLEVIEFPDGQVEKRYKDGSTEIRLPNGSIRYFDPKNEHVREEWRFPDGTALTVSANGEQRITFSNGQVEVHAKDHKRREFPDGTVKLVYNDGTSETRYASGRVRIKDKHGNLIMDSSSR